MSGKIVIAGGSGFIGQAVGRRWRERGFEVVLLTRHRARRRGDGLREVAWDGRAAGAWQTELDGAAAVVNLAGRSVNCVHTARNRRAILETRLAAIHALGEAVRMNGKPPPVWLHASAVGFYGSNTDETPRDEHSPAGTDFLADVCRRGEEAFTTVCPPGTRPVILRIGVVLGRRGGAFPPLLRVARAFLGGTAGSGRQGMSWIHLTDVEEIFLRAAADEGLRGVYNACGPSPAANREFMRALRIAARRPWCPPAPAPLVWLAARLAMRTDPSLVLRGQYVAPRRLQEAGFRFAFARLGPALDSLINRSG